MDKFYQVFKNGGHVMIHGFELNQYLQCGWVLKDKFEEPIEAPDGDVSVEDWKKMIHGISGEGSKVKLEEIGRGIGIEVDRRWNVFKVKKVLIDAYSKRNS